MPHHIAIVMDGNGRWATRRFLPRVAGHKQGVESLRRCVKACADRGVGVLTVFAFSSENWNRPVEEVSGLMDLMVGALGARGAEAEPGRRAAALRRRARRPVRQDRRGPGAGRGRDGAQHPAGAQRLLQLRRPLGHRARRGAARRARRAADRGQPRSRRWRCRTCPTPICSSAPAASSGCRTSCCGRAPTPSCSSATACGPSSTRPRSTRPLPPSSAASAASARLPRRSAASARRDPQAA